MSSANSNFNSNSILSILSSHRPLISNLAALSTAPIYFIVGQARLTPLLTPGLYDFQTSADTKSGVPKSRTKIIGAAGVLVALGLVGRPTRFYAAVLGMVMTGVGMVVGVENGLKYWQRGLIMLGLAAAASN